MNAALRPALVLLPGTLCDRRLFSRQAHALRGDAQVMLPSLHGLQRHHTVRQWAEALLSRLPPRFVVAGFSLGGLLALELLRLAPERVQGLALLASNAEAGSRVGQRRSARLWRDWHAMGAAAVARSLKPRYFHYERRSRRHARLVRDMAVGTPTRAARAQFEWAAQRPASLPLLAASRAPVLVVSGAHDRLCPRQLQQRIVLARPDAHWVELPRCGHFVPLEAAPALSRALRRWLRDIAHFETGVPT